MVRRCWLLLLLLLLLLGLAAAAELQQPAVSDWQARRLQLERHLAAATPPSANRTPAPGFDDTASLGALLPAEVVTRPRPEEYLPTAAVPKAWDWRNVATAAGAPPTDFTTRVRNQFLPFWCGSCWAHAATAVLGSRWRIHAEGALRRGGSPDFSVQWLVNCVENNSEQISFHSPPFCSILLCVSFTCQT